MGNFLILLIIIIVRKVLYVILPLNSSRIKLSSFPPRWSARLTLPPLLIMTAGSRTTSIESVDSLSVKKTMLILKGKWASATSGLALNSVYLHVACLPAQFGGREYAS